MIINVLMQDNVNDDLQHQVSKLPEQLLVIIQDI